VEGLIELTPNRGAVVSTPTMALSLEHFALLAALETLAAELACVAASAADIGAIIEANTKMKEAGASGDIAAFLHLNNEVHRGIVGASRNRPLVDAHQVVSRQIIRVQNLNGPLEHGVEESLTEHDALLEALRRRDRRRAVSLIRAHLKTVEDNLRARLNALEVY
jgi:DNA-binding GntR family transcriptional regulator